MPVQIRAFDYALPADSHKTVVQDGAAFEAMLRRLEDAPVLGFDWETSGLAWYRHARGCGLALGAWGEDGRVHAYYVPLRHKTGEPQLDIARVGPALRDLLANPRSLKVAHYIKFDDHITRREGWRLGGGRYCTATAARLYNENDLAALKHRAVTDLGCQDAQTWEDHISWHIERLSKAYGAGITPYRDRFGYSEIPIAICGRYACFDIDYCLRLHAKYERGTDAVSASYSRVTATEMALTEVLCDVEETGMPVDVPYLEGLRETLSGQLGSLEAKVWEAFPEARPFALSNDNQLRAFLIDELQLPLFERTKSGDQFAVTRKVLEHFAEEVPGLLTVSAWRDAQKIATTYTTSILEKLDAHDVVHCEFHQMGTYTGRLASSSPNLQNIVADSAKRAFAHSGKSLEDGGIDPWSCRRAFVVPKGYARVFLDYSQIELRVLTWYCKDPILLDSYAKGEDVHTRTSLEVFNTADPSMRRIAKVVNFGLVYGLSAKGLSRQAKIEQSLAEQYLRAYFDRYRGVPAFRDKFWAWIRRHGGFFKNLWGRPRRVPEISARDKWERLRAERKSFGSLIQGTAAELTKESMVRIARYLQAEAPDARIVNTIHDEIQIDMPIDYLARLVPMLRHLMCDYPEFAPVPILVEGKASHRSWADAYSDAAKLPK